MASISLPSNGSSNWGTPLSAAINAVNAETEAATAGVASLESSKLATADAPELIRDTVGATLVEGANVTITVSDVGDTITISSTGGGGGGGDVSDWGDIGGTLSDQIDLQEALDAKVDVLAAPELIRDTVGTTLVGGANISVEADDPSNTITISSAVVTPIYVCYWDNGASLWLGSTGGPIPLEAPAGVMIRIFDTRGHADAPVYEGDGWAGVTDWFAIPAGS